MVVGGDGGGDADADADADGDGDGAAGLEARSEISAVVPLRARRTRRMCLSLCGRLAMVKGLRRSFS